jgi:hypothetical protein
MSPSGWCFGFLRRVRIDPKVSGYQDGIRTGSGGATRCWLGIGPPDVSTTAFSG